MPKKIDVVLTDLEYLDLHALIFVHVNTLTERKESSQSYFTEKFNRRIRYFKDLAKKIRESTTEIGD